MDSTLILRRPSLDNQWGGFALLHQTISYGMWAPLGRPVAAGSQKREYSASLAWGWRIYCLGLFHLSKMFQGLVVPPMRPCSYRALHPDAHCILCVQSQMDPPNTEDSLAHPFNAMFKVKFCGGHEIPRSYKWRLVKKPKSRIIKRLLTL